VSNPTQQTTIYAATFTVRAGSETLWTGKVYAQRVEFGAKGWAQDKHSHNTPEI
jgi:hypothetical protein